MQNAVCLVKVPSRSMIQASPVLSGMLDFNSSNSPIEDDESTDDSRSRSNIEQSSPCIIYSLLQFTHFPEIPRFVGIGPPLLGAFTYWAIVSSLRCRSSDLSSIQAENVPESTSASHKLVCKSKMPAHRADVSHRSVIQCTAPVCLPVFPGICAS